MAGEAVSAEDETGDFGRFVTSLGRNVAGAPFLALPMLIPLLHALAAAALSITLMHGFVYAVSFTGGHERSPKTPPISGLRDGPIRKTTTGDTEPRGGTNRGRVD